MTGTTIRFGGYQPPASVHNRAGEVLGAALGMRLGDALAFELEGNVRSRRRRPPRVQA